MIRRRWGYDEFGGGTAWDIKGEDEEDDDSRARAGEAGTCIRRGGARVVDEVQSGGAACGDDGGTSGDEGMEVREEGCDERWVRLVRTSHTRQQN